MFYKLLAHKESTGKLFIPSVLSSGKAMQNGSRIGIHAGLLRHLVDVEELPSLKDDELMISMDVLDTLHIPEGLKYQIILSNNAIRLGPVIGLLLAHSRTGLSIRKPDVIMNYTLLYKQINGILCVFSTDGIDFENHTIRGYFYNPDMEKSGGVWQEGILPVPDSIFTRTVLRKDTEYRLKKLTANRLFNSCYFDKWELYKMLSRVDSVGNHIPDTRPLKSTDDVYEMLEKHGSVYIKLLNGTLSRGLFKVSKTKDTYAFQDKQGNLILENADKERADSFIINIIKGHKYLVQQALHPLAVDGRHMDLRVIMQKDHTKQWGCTGIISFVGTQRSICSNWGYELTMEDVFTRRLNYSQEEYFKKRTEIINVCKNACEALDIKGENFGDLGIDVLVDESLKVWILEANKRHYHSIPLWINDNQTFYATKTNPIKYATALSGFRVY